MTLVLVHHLWNAPHEYNPKYDIHYTVGTQLHTELKAGLKLVLENFFSKIDQGGGASKGIRSKLASN